MKQVFVFVFFLTQLLKLIPGYLSNMPFTMDQGRDLIDVRQIWEGKDLKLIGPTTSINGVHLGPLYYYLISIPFLFTSGEPISILIWQILFFHLAVFYFWFTFKRNDLHLASIVSVAILLSPISFYANRYFWNANFMIGFSLFYFTLLLKHSISKLNLKLDFFLGLISGLSLQIEAAFGILFLPFTLINFLFRRLTIPQYSRFALGYFITLLPQIIFELAKGFPMTKIFLLEISGQTNILGEKMTYAERLVDRINIYKNALTQASNINPDILIPIFLISLGLFFLYIKSNSTSVSLTLTKLSVSFLVFSLVFYLFYPSTLKHWYVFSLSLVFCLSLGAIIGETYSRSVVGRMLAILLFALALWSFVKAQNEQFVQGALKSTNPSGYQNQITVVDKVYELADNQSFYLYNYIPSVYDYPFQYLFWSHGLKKNGYSPNDLAYLPGQPEYIKNKNSFLLNQKPVDQNTKTILIIQKGENSEHYNQWFGNFAHLCKVEEVNFEFSQKIIVLTPCLPK